MEMQEIDVFIENDGQVKIEVHGVKGVKCLDLTKALEDALGGEIEEREMHHEAYEKVEDFVDNQQRNQLG